MTPLEGLGCNLPADAGVLSKEVVGATFPPLGSRAGPRPGTRVPANTGTPPGCSVFHFACCLLAMAQRLRFITRMRGEGLAVQGEFKLARSSGPEGDVLTTWRALWIAHGGQKPQIRSGGASVVIRKFTSQRRNWGRQEGETNTRMTRSRRNTIGAV